MCVYKITLISRAWAMNVRKSLIAKASHGLAAATIKWEIQGSKQFIIDLCSNLIN